jgi:hypothetical protein
MEKHAHHIERLYKLKPARCPQIFRAMASDNAQGRDKYRITGTGEALHIGHAVSRHASRSTCLPSKAVPAVARLRGGSRMSGSCRE